MVFSWEMKAPKAPAPTSTQGEFMGGIRRCSTEEEVSSSSVARTSLAGGYVTRLLSVLFQASREGMTTRAARAYALTWGEFSAFIGIHQAGPDRGAHHSSTVRGVC